MCIHYDQTGEKSLRDKEVIEEKRRWLTEATAGYCQDQLNDEYRDLCEKLIDKMVRKRTVPFLSGKMERGVSGHRSLNFTRKMAV